MTDWSLLADWWLEEVGDLSYAEEVHPLLFELLGDVSGKRVLEVGAGEGQVLRLLRERGAEAVGMDVSGRLAARAGVSFVGRLPSLGAVRDEVFDLGLAVLVFEHLPSLEGVFEELARVTKPGGRCVLVINHPLITAPEAGPLTDPTDGEVFLRPGRYFEGGFTDEPAGTGLVRFHHRPLGELLETAAGAGWILARLVERGISPARVERDPSFLGHEHLPRLLGACWRKPG